MQLHQILTLPFLRATATVRVRLFPVLRRILADHDAALVDALRSPMARECIAAMRDYVNREAGDNKRLLVLGMVLEQLLALSQRFAAGFEAPASADVQRESRRLTRGLLMHLQHADSHTVANWRGYPSPIGERMSPEQFDAVRDRCVAFLLDYVGTECDVG